MLKGKAAIALFVKDHESRGSMRVAIGLDDL